MIRVTMRKSSISSIYEQIKSSIIKIIHYIDYKSLQHQHLVKLRKLTVAAGG